MQLKEKQKDLSLNRIDKKIIAVEKEKNIPILKHIFFYCRDRNILMFVTTKVLTIGFCCLHLENPSSKS